MKVEHMLRVKEFVTFADLKQGECFIYEDLKGISHNLMRLNESFEYGRSAVWLNDGDVTEFNDTDEVRRLT